MSHIIYANHDYLSVERGAIPRGGWLRYVRRSNDLIAKGWAETKRDALHFARESRKPRTVNGVSLNHILSVLP